ncbi:uncharacterized protein [Physcomitrium patens]|uniref:uncharacterized protein n=1 Tax=Physcomitrium patens TaxID=3218 RepID=UPI003CCE5328
MSTCTIILQSIHIATPSLHPTPNIARNPSSNVEKPNTDSHGVFKFGVPSNSHCKGFVVGFSQGDQFRVLGSLGQRSHSSHAVGPTKTRLGAALPLQKKCLLCGAIWAATLQKLKTKQAE